MPLVVKDRVQETTTTQGTGAYSLAGAVQGFQSFSVIGNANTTYYAVTDGTNWEVGLGTYTASGTTLSRDTILESSNSGNAVDWIAGTKNVFVTYPAERAAFGDQVPLISATAPTSPVNTQLWFNSTEAVNLAYYTSKWVDTYPVQLTSTISMPDMDGGTASTTSWTYSINCGGAA